VQIAPHLAAFESWASPIISDSGDACARAPPARGVVRVVVLLAAAAAASDCDESEAEAVERSESSSDEVEA
jgi:hypothetical protein